jgi:hypothetical protein
MTGLTPEQEIRARALDAAVTLIDIGEVDAVRIAETVFAPYIRDAIVPAPTQSTTKKPTHLKPV